MKRFIAAALIVCLALAPVPVDARQAAAPAIASLDRASVKPFQKLVIRGSGFDPNGAISVVFMPRSRGSRVSVPAYAATTTTLEVIVPPIPETTNGFGFGATDVQVVQVGDSAVSASNVHTGLDIQPMTAVPASIRKGALLRGYYRALRSALEATRDGARASDATRSAVNSYLQAQNELVEKIDRIIADPGYATTVATGDNTQLVLDARALQFADQLLLAFMEGADSYVPTSARHRVVAADVPVCDPQTGEINADALVCNIAQSVVRQSNRLSAGALLAAGAVVVVGALYFQVPLIALTGGIVAVGLAVAAANYLVGSAVCATMGETASLDNGLPFSEVMRDQGRKMLATAREYGAAVPVIANAAMDVFATSAHAAGVPSTGPQGGMAVNVPGQDPANGQMLMTFRGADAAATAERYAAPVAQGSRPAAESRQPAPAIGNFDGSYSGTVNWFASQGGSTLSGTLGVSLTISGGRITVTAPIAGSGSVSAAGAAGGTVNGGGLACSWSGSFTAAASTGPASGGGVFGCSSAEGRTWGGWNASRR